jgi:hypothetical protein
LRKGAQFPPEIEHQAIGRFGKRRDVAGAAKIDDFIAQYVAVVLISL